MLLDSHVKGSVAPQRKPASAKKKELVSAPSIDITASPDTTGATMKGQRGLREKIC